VKKKYMSEDQLKTSLTLLQLFRQMWPYLSRQRGLFYRVSASIFFLVLIGRSLPFLLGLAIDRGLIVKDYQFVFRLAAVYLFLEIIHTYLIYYHAASFARLGNQALYFIREDLVRHTQKLPVSYFDKNPVGRIVTRLTNDVNGLNELFARGLLSLLLSVLELIAIFGALLYISPRLTLVALASTPLLIWSTLKLSAKVRVVLRESKKKQSAINAYIAESINGMSVAQLFFATAARRREFDRLSTDYADKQIQSIKIYSMLWPITSLFTATSVGVALLYGGYLNQSAALAMGSLVAFITHLFDFSHPVRTLLERYHQLQNGLTSAERVFQILDEKPEPDQPLVSTGYPLTLKGEIRFSNVSFRYSSDLPWAVKNLNFSIQPGQSIALVGRTGSGKSTIISLLSRFYLPSEGVISLAGKNIQSFFLNDYRQLLGIVQQDNFLFQGTIADNISLKNPNIDMDRIEWAAKASYCWPFIERLKGGLYSEVQERGANLSAGQRQLIVFARVLAYDPQLLILDEATSNIDSKSEELIQQATEKIISGRTSIVIAHRLSTILDCDEIIVMKDGTIAERGEHADLLLQGGIYASLHHSQQDHHSSQACMLNEDPII
jgi:ATP-binding cassette subfamily B protein